MARHDCIEKANRALAEKNTRIELVFSAVERQRPIIRTVKIDPKKRVGPIMLLATFCPFCGKDVL